MSASRLGTGVAWQQNVASLSSPAGEKWAAPEDWDRHRQTITRLYLDENRTLKEVMTIMAKDYGHRGTLKMYKSRITKWRLDKNNKESDMAVVLREKILRDAVGKRSSFLIRGKPFEIQEIMRYFKRRGTKENPAFRVASPSVNTPPYITCSTPSSVSTPRTFPEGMQENTASAVDTELWELAIQIVQHGLANNNTPEEQRLNQDIDEQNAPQYLDIQPFHRWSSLNPEVPRIMSPPQVLLLPEQLFTSIRTYFSGSFGNNTWRSDERGACFNSATCAVEVDLNAFYVSCKLAGRLMIMQSFVEARRVLSKACARIENMLKAEHPQTLNYLLKALMGLKCDGLVEVTAQIQAYISKMAASRLPQGHPWSQICKLLESVSTDDLEPLGATCLGCISDVFEQELGLFHRTTLECRTDFIHRCYGGALVGAERQLRKLLSGCEQKCVTSDAPFLVIMYDLAFNLYVQERYTEVEVLGGELVKGAQESRTTWYEVYGLELSAYAQYGLDKMHLAEKNVREAIEICISQYGRQHPQVIRDISILEGWLREWGREAEADELRQEMVELIGPDELVD